MKRINDNSLYLVTSQEYAPEKSTLDIAKDAIAGGIDILQMREKKATKKELHLLGRELSRLCSGKGVIFIVNDDPVLACQVGADGVHLGQEDLRKYPLSLTRAIVSKERIIGVSTHSIDQFREANESDCDYIAFGPIFPTPTKDYSIGEENIGKVMSAAKKPVVVIGGIDMDNINTVLERGAKNIAVIRAIVRAENIAARVKEIKNKMDSFAKK
jgi:thiamine-phosphate pyrophosphorylase